MSQITDRTSVSREYARKILENAGVTEFDSKRPGYLTGTMPYGWKRQNGKLVFHLSEQRVIVEMQRLRICGESLRSITYSICVRSALTKINLASPLLFYKDKMDQVLKPAARRDLSVELIHSR